MYFITILCTVHLLNNDKYVLRIPIFAETLFLKYIIFIRSLKEILLEDLKVLYLLPG